MQKHLIWTLSATNYHDGEIIHAYPIGNVGEEWEHTKPGSPVCPRSIRQAMMACT
jgi:hypothetical protein